MQKPPRKTRFSEGFCARFEVQFWGTISRTSWVHPLPPPPEGVNHQRACVVRPPPLVVPSAAQSPLGWEIHSEFRRIPQLIRFQTFWTPKLSSEFYFTDRKMCSRQFWTRFFRFGILSRHRFFRFHESENVPAIFVSGIILRQTYIYSLLLLVFHFPLSVSRCRFVFHKIE